jgi:hypothetical protein
MTFDEWFNDAENYGMRCERFYYEDAMFIVKWLEAAYQVGYEHRDKELMDDGK